MLCQPNKTAIEYLSSRDKTLGAYIAKRGPLSYETYATPFEALVSAIISQQISTYAVPLVTQRIIERFGEFVPENYKNVTAEELAKCGITLKKARCILAVAELANDGKLEYDDLNRLSNEALAHSLCKIDGIGKWTVQMLQIFCLNRPDILSRTDYGMIHGIKNLYGLAEITEIQFNRFAKLWSPHGTVASLYLWQAATDSELEAVRKAKFAK